MIITCNSADSLLLKGYRLPLIIAFNSADSGPYRHYMLPLIIICNSADHRPSDKSDNNSLRNFFVLSKRTVNVSVRDLLALFVPYFFHIALIVYTSVS